MALRVEEASSEAQKLRDLYAVSDPVGWDACRQRGVPFGQPLYVIIPIEWSDFALWKWTGWQKYLRRIALGFMRHPSQRDRIAAKRFSRGTRGRWVAGDVGIVEPVQEACRMAGLTARQIEVWRLSEGLQLSQRGIAQAVGISQPMVKRHLDNARARLAKEWGVISSGLEVDRTIRGCAWRYRGFVCRVCCQQFQTKRTEV